MPALDQPVRASLFSEHARLAIGNDRARHYRPDIHHFAATREDVAPDAEALARLLSPGERVTLMQAGEVVLGDSLVVVSRRKAIQLLATRAITATPSRHEILALGQADAEEMLALAELTQPGPFAPNTWRMGDFIGIRIDGRLAAMAGERLRFPGYSEVSGVCSHPDFRGQGLARLLSCRVAERVFARGATPFLHAWHDNAAAIGLYQSLGFRPRGELVVTVVER